MKKIISKLALTLGLILMFGANAFAQPDSWDEYADATIGTPITSANPELPGWFIVCRQKSDGKNANENGTWALGYSGDKWDRIKIGSNGTSADFPSGTVTAGSLADHIVYISADGTIQAPNGTYLGIEAQYKDNKIDKGVLNTNNTNWTIEYRQFTNPEGTKVEGQGICIYDPTIIKTENNGKTKMVGALKVGKDKVEAGEANKDCALTLIPVEIAAAGPVEYTVEYDGLTADEVGMFSYPTEFADEDGESVSKTSIVTNSKINAGNVATLITPAQVDGYQATISFSNKVITITYTLPTEYTVVVSPADAGSFTLKEGLTLLEGNKFKTWDEITSRNVTEYVFPANAAEGYLFKSVSISGNTITVLYIEPQVYTVVYVDNKCPDGGGYTLKNGAVERDGNIVVPDILDNDNLLDYVTPKFVNGFSEGASVSGNTITIGYTAGEQAKSFTDGYLLYKVTKNAVAYGAKGTVSVELTDDGKKEATSVSIPVSVSNGAYSYDVTSIPAFGFTTQYGTTEHSSTNDDQDKAIAADFNAGNISAISLRVENGIAYHTNCSNPENRTNERGDDMDTKKDFGKNGVSLSTGDNARYSYYFLGYNPNLVSVEIPADSKITTIGNNAFSGCWNLESFYVPFSVTSIGIGAFGGCISMSDFQFATGMVNGQPNMTQLTEIPDYMFIHCESLTTLRIPEGITTLGERSTQYMLRLSKIELPSTLVTIEGEFLCTALSLKTLTIPAKVETIGASAFHGCEALEHIYFLGAPSALSMGTGSNVTFGPNDGYCALAIRGCAFHVLPQYLYNTKAPEGEQSEFDKYHGAKEGAEGYKNAFNADTYENSWGKVDGVNGNYFTAEFPEVEKKYVPGKWVTFCMPESEIFFEIEGEKGELANPTFVEYNEETKKKHTEGGGTTPEGGNQSGYAVKARPAATTGESSGFLKYNFEYGWGDYDGFGPGCLVAQMTDVWQDPDTDNKSQLYHANFVCIDINQIQPNTPYLICPMVEEGTSQTDLNICLWTDNDLKRDAFISNMGEEAKHTKTLHTDDTKQTSVGTTRPAFVHMIGQINRGEENPLLPGDIYFKSAGTGWQDNKGKLGNIGTFYMVEEGKTAYLHSCSAYWQVVQGTKEDGGYVSTEVKLGSVADFEDVPADPTAINEVQTDNQPRIIVEGIYDMSGRKLDVDQSQLPEGMYIMNGKKVLNK